VKEENQAAAQASIKDLPSTKVPPRSS
jgi:hypothetical protein